MEEISALADLLRQRNLIDAQIGELIKRPASPGHIGEWIASAIFNIEPNAAANATGADGVFRDGPLSGLSVNVKWYSQRDGKLDLKSTDGPDFYLVLSGPISAARSSAGQLRPMRIDSVYLINSTEILADLAERKRFIGTASSVRKEIWDAAEVYPRAANSLLPLSDAQRSLLASFATN